MQFFTNLRSALSAPVGNRQTSNANDIIQTRRNFSRLGRHDGDTGLTVLDRGLDSTIRTFQRDKGLKQDGIMNPGWETERALNRELKNSMRPPEERQPYFASPVRLSAPVGNSKANQSDDVKQVQRSLGRLGLASESKLYEPSGILDRETIDSMRAFQGSNDLRVDGFMNPGGETETAINSSLYRLASPMAEDGEGRDGDNEEETPPPPPPEDDEDEEGDEGDGNNDGDEGDEEDPEEPDCSDKEQALEEAEEELRQAEEKFQPLLDELIDLATSIRLLEEELQQLEEELGTLEEEENKKNDCEALEKQLRALETKLAKLAKLETDYETAVGNAEIAVNSNNNAVQQVAAEYVEYVITKVINTIPLRRVLKILGIAEKFNVIDSDEEAAQEVKEAQDRVSDLNDEALSATEEALSLFAKLESTRTEIENLRKDVEACNDRNNKK